MMLFTAAFAVWMTYLFNRHFNAALVARIATVRPLARELVVDDEAKAAVVKLEELWIDHNRWDIYLPAGEFRLCLATRAIGNDGLAPVVASRSVAPGRHTIGLALRKEKAGWRIEASCDGAKPVTADEPLGWIAKKGSTTSGAFSESTTLPGTEPIVLHRCTFLRMQPGGVVSSTGGPSEGILLWIEPVSGSTGRR
jgi:hypothetical protein